MMPSVLKTVVKIHESVDTAAEAIETQTKEMESEGFKAVFLE